MPCAFGGEPSSREDAPSHLYPWAASGAQERMREDFYAFCCSCLAGAGLALLQGSSGTVQPQAGGKGWGWEKSCWTSTCSPWKGHLSSAAQPDSLSDEFWLLWAVLNGSALLSLLRDWDVLPCLVRSLPASLLPSPLLPCWQKNFIF